MHRSWGVPVGDVDAGTTGSSSSVRELVFLLIEKASMTPQEISEAMEKRVSGRTIYRWARGESAPQNDMDLKVLEELVAQRCK